MEFDIKTYDQIGDYISGTLQKESQKEFEKRMQFEPLLKQEVDLHRSLKYAVNEKEWFLMEPDQDNEDINLIRDLKRSEKYSSIEANIKNIGDQYFEGNLVATKNSETNKERKWLYYVSGLVAVLCISFFIKDVTLNNSADQLYTEYSNWNTLPSLTVQNDETNVLAEGERLFFEKDYTKAITLFSNIAEETKQEKTANSTYVLSYLGASYLESGDYTKAMATYNKLEQSNTLDSSKAYWYKALVYLKQDDKVNAKAMLEKTLESEQNYNFKKANELLKKLD